MTGCPYAFVGEEVRLMTHYADLYKKGLPPVDAGALDQSHGFTVAAEIFWNECAMFKAKNNPLSISEDDG